MGLAKMQVIAPDVDPEDDAGDVQERPEELRLLEAMLFAASEPLSEKDLAARLPQGTDVADALKRLQQDYAPRGVSGLELDTVRNPRAVYRLLSGLIRRRSRAINGDRIRRGIGVPEHGTENYSGKPASVSCLQLRILSHRSRATRDQRGQCHLYEGYRSRDVRFLRHNIAHATGPQCLNSIAGAGR